MMGIKRSFAIFCMLLSVFGLFPLLFRDDEDVLLPPSVVQVFDGDTIELTEGGRKRKIRYLLIDTPELHHPSRPAEELGEDARSFNALLLSKGQIRLEYDRELEDKYGRLLAYVFVGNSSGEIFISEELVRYGLALPMVIPPNDKYALRVFRAMEEARNEKRGLWRRADNRLFSAAQAWNEAPFLAGSFITLIMAIDKIETSGRRIFLRNGRTSISAYRSPQTESLWYLREGNSLQAAGKLIASYAGCEIQVVSDLQVSLLPE
jgi:micrococcal nuclease